MRAVRLVLAVTALALPAAGQVLYQTDFSDSTGWVFTHPKQGIKDPHWAVDDRPGQTPFGVYLSPPYSLNYNNDVDYNGPLAIPGESARSPIIDLSLATGVPQLEFWCNNVSCEGTCSTHERLQIKIVDLGGSNVVAPLCLNWAGYYGPVICIQGGGWHPHHYVLDRSWGQVRIEFRARHDGIANSCEGWFIDDLVVLDNPAPTAYCTAKLNSQGCLPQIGTTGMPALSSGAPLVIAAGNVVNNKVGIFFYGLGGQAAIPFQGGTLCMGTPRRRTPQQQSGGNPPPNDCSGRFSFDFQAWALSGVHPALTAGIQVNGQFWYRDQGVPFNTGLTDAIDFTLLP